MKEGWAAGESETIRRKAVGVGRLSEKSEMKLDWEKPKQRNPSIILPLPELQPPIANQHPLQTPEIKPNKAQD